MPLTVDSEAVFARLFASSRRTFCLDSAFNLTGISSPTISFNMGAFAYSDT